MCYSNAYDVGAKRNKNTAELDPMGRPACIEELTCNAPSCALYDLGKFKDAGLLAGGDEAAQPAATRRRSRDCWPRAAEEAEGAAAAQGRVPVGLGLPSKAATAEEEAAASQ